MCVMSVLVKNKAPETKEIWKLKQFVFSFLKHLNRKTPLKEYLNTYRVNECSCS